MTEVMPCYKAIHLSRIDRCPGHEITKNRCVPIIHPKKTQILRLRSGRMSGRVTPQFSTAKSLLENFTVRTYTNQPQCQFVWLFIDEKQVGLEMALAMVGIFTR